MDKVVLKDLKVGQSGKGLVLLKQLMECTSKNGNKYLRGSVQNKQEVQCVIWASASAYSGLKDLTLVGCVLNIHYEVIEFAGSPCISISVAIPVNEACIDEFLVTKYNLENISNLFWKELNKSLSDKGYKLAREIFEVDSENENSLWSAFRQEFAAQKHHDNCVGGLLAHTLKCIFLAEFVYLNYFYLSELKVEESLTEQDEKDLLFLGIALHDIGKTKEMCNGIYQPLSQCTHREIGIEMLFPYKEKILEAYGERGWVILTSIILGHHDEYGDSAKTVYAYLAHWIDNMDATLTGIGQSIESMLDENTVGKFIYYNGKRLYL